jgi:hypothetical protein
MDVIAIGAVLLIVGTVVTMLAASRAAGKAADSIKEWHDEQNS